MNNEDKKKFLLELANDRGLLEIARLAIEDSLIEFRDSRLSEPLRRNGLVVAEKDGERSDIIRFGSETAVRIGLEAIANSLDS